MLIVVCCVCVCGCGCVGPTFSYHTGRKSTLAKAKWPTFVHSYHKLVWEVCSEFCRIPRLIRFRTFELRNFHWNCIFPIVKCVYANSEHDSSGSESSPAINSSDFMNQKTFLLYVSGEWHQILIQRTIFFCAHHRQTTAHNIYLIHTNL